MRAFVNPRQYKWLPWLIIGMAVLTVTTVALALHYVESRLVASKGESLALAAAEIADKLDLLLVEQYDTTLELSRTQVFRKDGVAAQSAYLTTVKKTHPIYLWLGVTDAEGRIVIATDPASVGQNRSRSSWFQAARDTGGVHISAAEPFEETGGTDAISFTTPIKGADGKFQGTVTTRVGLPALEEVLTRTIHAFRTREKLVGSIEYQFMNDKGMAFIDSDLIHKGNVNLKQLGLPSALLSESGQPGYVEELHKRRLVPVITGYAQTREFDQFPDLKWTILLRMDQSDLLTPIRKVLWTLGALSLLIGGPLFIMLVWSTTRLKEEWTLAQEEHARAVAAEAKYRLALRAARMGTWSWDSRTGHISWSNTTEVVFGLVPGSFSGTYSEYRDRIHPDDRAFVEHAIAEAVENGKPYSIRHRIVRPDGAVRWLSCRGDTLCSENNRVVQMTGTVTDITERKQAEEALERSEKRFRAMIEHSTDGVVLSDPVKNMINFASASIERIIGYTPEDLVGKKMPWDLVHPDHLQGARKLWAEALQEPGKVVTGEVLIRHKDGSWRWIERTLTNLLHEPNVQSVVANFRDITERKQAEEALRANEQRMRAILDGALDAVVGMDEQGVITDWNPQAEVIFGRSRSEAIGQNLAETIIPPRYREQHHHGMRYFLATGEGPLLNRRIEISALRRDGTEFPVELTVSYSMQGDSRMFTAFIADITERKRAENLLARSRDFYLGILEEFPAMIWRSGVDSKCDYFNKTWLSFTGRTLEQERGDGWAESVHPDDVKQCVTSYLKAFHARESFVLEYRLRRHDGEYRYVYDHGSPFSDLEGNFKGYIGACYDITERKQADEALRESERRFRTIFDQAPLGMAVINSASGQFRRINRKFCEIVGYPHKEMLARTFQDITHPDDLQADLDNMTRLMEGRIHNFQMEKRYIRKDGAVVWVNLMCVPLWWDHETDRRFHIAMVKDITERKKAEEEQRRLLAEVAQSRNHFEAIFRSTPSAISIATLKDGRFIEVNESAARLTGYSREELLGRTSVELGLWVDPDERPDFVRKLVEKGQLLNWERQIRTKQGEVRDAIFCFERIQVDAEPCLISIAHDITERKRAEAALRERSHQQAIEAELSLLAITAPDLPNLLNATIKLVADVLEMDYCAVLQLLPNGKELLLRAGQGWKEDLVGHATMSTEFASLAGYTLLSNVPVVIEDFRAETRFKVHPLLHDHGVVSGMSFIIHGKDEPWGALGAYTTRRRSFSRDDVDFFRTVCNILATAIERMQTEDVLRSANQTLRTLSRQLLQVQEEDRRTIARDLHDEIGQSLTAIKLNVERAQRTSDRAARGRIMTDCVQITDSVLNQVRNLSLDLHPSILDDLGLSYALKWYADRQAERAGLKVEVTADPSGPRLPQDVEIVCFRIAQEALTNVVRHAQASRASITLKRLAKRVELRIQDDGVGFDVRTVQSPMGSGTNIGLTGMRERARLVGGEVHVRSVPHKGTEVTALVPLPSVPSADTTTMQVPPS